MSEDNREGRDNRDREGREGREGRDNRNQNYGNFNRNRGGRDRNNNRNFRPGGQHRGGGRIQRPLLTSAINGAGLCLVTLAILYKGTTVNMEVLYLGLSTVAFVLSALISYGAQRLSGMRWVEKISDLFFFLGSLGIIWVALHLGDVLGYFGL
jgi:hypothetical protein